MQAAVLTVLAYAGAAGLALRQSDPSGLTASAPGQQDHNDHQEDAEAHGGI